MHIITRNFFKLLRAGVFKENEEIEPMSAWKWRRTYDYALMHDLSALLSDGLDACRNQFFLQLPDDLQDEWYHSTQEIERKNRYGADVLNQLYQELNRKQLRPILFDGYRLAALYDHPEHRLSSRINIFFPFSTQGQKADHWAQRNGININDQEKDLFSYEWKEMKVYHYHTLQQLTNRLLNHSLQTIIEQELRESEVLHMNSNILSARGTLVNYEVTSNTLTLLYLFTVVAKRMLNNAVPLKQLVDIGILLRKVGDRVDFVKLQTWLEKLHLLRVAHLSGLMLIEYLHFSVDEIPFLNSEQVSDTFVDLKKINYQLFSPANNQPSMWYFSQGKDIFVHSSNSSAMIGHVQRSVSSFRYYPQESITNFISSFLRSLSHIEE